MGRRRSKHFDLPPRMQQKGTHYYFVCSGPSRKWIPLGADLAKAKRLWADLDAGTPQGLSVGDLVQRYIDREARPASTLAQYASYQRALAAAFPIPAAQLRSQHVALWRELNGHRRNYANGCIALLVSSFRLGAELGLCMAITVGKWPTEPRPRDLLPAELRSIRSQSPDWLKSAIDLAYITGQRPSDIRALKWESVRQDRIAIRQIKTGSRLEIMMTDDLRSVLDRARARPILGLYVVATDKGQPITDDQLGYAWRKACAAAGVEDAQFRDIRAMAAKAAKADGLDFQALLGHTTRAMSERYIKGRQTVIAEPVRRKL